jgi:hypothetical protein
MNRFITQTQGQEGSCTIVCIGLYRKRGQTAEQMSAIVDVVGRDNIPRGMGEEARTDHPLPTGCIPATATALVAVRNTGCVGFLTHNHREEYSHV